MRLSSAAQMRECDRLTIEAVGLPGIALMESAGRAAAARLAEMLAARSLNVAHVALFCGGGNNGGDGFVIARELLRAGHRAEVYLLAPRTRLQGDADVNLRVLERLLRGGLTPGTGAVHRWGDRLAEQTPIAALLANLTKADLVVDAVLGTGLSSTVRAPFDAVIGHINAQPSPVFAVDLPSGLSADTGQPLGDAVRADLTVTFGLAKIGLMVSPGRELCGELEVIDIGLPPGVYEQAGVNAEALTLENIAHRLPARPRTGHKGTFGHVLALGGCDGSTGALILCAHAALRAGAGLVTAGGSRTLAAQVAAVTPEIMSTVVLPESADAQPPLQTIEALAKGRIVAAGPGMGRSTTATALVRHLLESCHSPLVLDADALNAVAQVTGAPQHATLRAASDRRPIVLTPHPGEFARLTGVSTAQLLRDVVGHTRRYARATGCVVVCKTASTVIAHPDGRLAINTTGNSGMATGGAGDVLTGVIAAMMAQGLDAWEAACVGVTLHGAAGDLAAQAHGKRTLLAGDLIKHLGRAFLQCERALTESP